ncbi:RhoGAP-domain-containing protein [Pleurotus eryngii]|uniref:RhoGAP-domain-containing protein n=1 Tax=Pleurotus eryngii TaxID=5323 RepID=A0A9P6DE82_PLEER|nr:RhoGAP-domain-containing protein [Pleurotus eryngii]
MPSSASQNPWEGSLRGRASSHDHSTGRPDTSTTSLSSTSRSTSLSSSAAFSMQAASPSSSDIKSMSDHSAALAPAIPSTSSSSTYVSPQPRSSSLSHSMGQVVSSLSNSSKSGPPSPSGPSKASSIGNAAVATGHRLKRAFANRRKKTTDDALQTGPRVEGKTKANEVAAKLSPSSGARSFATETTQIFGKKQGLTLSQSPSPPIPPPKPATPQKVMHAPAPAQLRISPQSRPEQRSSIIPISPGISSALHFLHTDEHMREQEKRVAPTSPPVAEAEKARPEASDKEAWRKSDSTMSHHTIRPGSGPGNNRASRPVSMAESLQSNHTIVPPNKRLSALLTDADFYMPEEDSSDGDSSQSHQPPASSSRAQKRRSMSLNIASFSNFATKAQPSSPPLPLTTSPTPASADLKHPSKSIAEGAPILSPPASKEAPTLTRTAAGGIMTSSLGSQTAGTQIRGQLSAWNAATTSNLAPRSASQGDRPISPPQAQQHHHRDTRTHQMQAPSLRQTAISMTSGFAPAAGLAKRAVERMGRALAPSSYSSSIPENPLARVSSNHSGVSLGKGRPRRTPNAPSTSSWSVTSSTTSSSLSDNDMMPIPTGPLLGPCLRPPTGRGRLLFKRPLKDGFNEAPVVPRSERHDVADGEVQSFDGSGVSSSVLEDLESKRVPALVVRCAQHLLIWGVQEEGLFRVNGRPSHVSKLRSEFDSGADYDMTNCNPGDLDPHAVASVFKAYLRELPEPILTQALVPYFEAAMAKESSTHPPQEHLQSRNSGGKGPTLPSGPRSGIHAVRKPPSLSTLAMPSFAGMRPPSESLLNALRSLIAQLPSENRDLLRIVTDLINATAKESKATKMPLSNLLLVFCPSLNMSPPLLRVLCEATSIWEPHVEPKVLDIRRESVIIDIKSPAADDDGKEKVDQNEQPDASTERLPQSVDTVYMDASDHISIANSSVTYSSDASSRDDVSYVSTSEGVIPRQLPPSPPLSSSVESLSTPSTSTDDRSFDDEHDLYLKRPSRGSPVIADSNSSSPLSTSPGRPTISRPILTAKPPTINSPLNLNSPIQFPLTTSIPPTPVSAVRKRSFPSLSLPSFSPFNGPSPTSPSASSPAVQTTKASRLRKPSLRLPLAHRASGSPVASPTGQGVYLQAPRAASDSSVSTPISAVTAPQSSLVNLPPLLSMQIESSKLDLDKEPIQVWPEPTPQPAGSIKSPRPLPAIPGSVIKKEMPTPIADRYRSDSTASIPVSLLSSSGVIPRPTLRSSASKASVSSRASNHLGLLDDDGDREDWTKSVLMAAEANGKWTSLH